MGSAHRTVRGRVKKPDMHTDKGPDMYTVTQRRCWLPCALCVRGCISIACLPMHDHKTHWDHLQTRLVYASVMCVCKCDVCMQV